MAKQLALHDLLRKRSAVQRHEIALGAPAPAVQQACHHFLAATRLAGQQDIHIGIGNLPYCIAQPLHNRCLADERQRFLETGFFSRRFSRTSRRFSSARLALSSMRSAERVLL